MCGCGGQIWSSVVGLLDGDLMHRLVLGMVWWCGEGWVMGGNLVEVGVSFFAFREGMARKR